MEQHKEGCNISLPARMPICTGQIVIKRKIQSRENMVKNWLAINKTMLRMLLHANIYVGKQVGVQVTLFILLLYVLPSKDNIVYPHEPSFLRSKLQQIRLGIGN